MHIVSSLREFCGIERPQHILRHPCLGLGSGQQSLGARLAVASNPHIRCTCWDALSPLPAQKPVQICISFSGLVLCVQHCLMRRLESLSSKEIDRMRVGSWWARHLDHHLRGCRLAWYNKHTHLDQLVHAGWLVR